MPVTGPAGRSRSPCRRLSAWLQPGRTRPARRPQGQPLPTAAGDDRDDHQGQLVKQPWSISNRISVGLPPTPIVPPSCLRSPATKPPVRRHDHAVDGAEHPDLGVTTRLLAEAIGSLEPPAPARASRKRISSVLALGVGMHVAVRAAVLVAAVAGAAIEVWAVRAGWSWVAAALDLLAGWSLLAAAGWAVHLTGGCRGLMGLSGIFWFLATPQIVGGTAGHAAALLGGAWLAPLASACGRGPGARPMVASADRLGPGRAARRGGAARRRGGRARGPAGGNRGQPARRRVHRLPRRPDRGSPRPRAKRRAGPGSAAGPPSAPRWPLPPGSPSPWRPPAGSRAGGCRLPKAWPPLRPPASPPRSPPGRRWRCPAGPPPDGARQPGSRSSCSRQR